MATPGHTPACMVHVAGDAVFVGDTMFMPDAGSARADFPGGDAGELFDSIQKVLSLPDDMRLFMCHNYGPNGRDIQWETTVGDEKANNIHVGAGASRETFVKLRTDRDATLAVPKLIIPSLQVNMRAGEIPADEAGNPTLKVPITGCRPARFTSFAKQSTAERYSMQITQLDALTYVGPQISLSDITNLKRHGVCKIIVARPEGETCDQPTISEIMRAANAVGIEVHQIPVVPGQITDEDVSAFDACAAQSPGPVFAYCRSGMRATSLWAINKSNGGHCADTILSAAQDAGYDLTALSPRLVTKPATTA